ncbi:MAG: hypothetical protein II712_04045 [Erysipelotrichaceae bacterium]|nr:hypothetical protein [Erysipelotrichaceae bacterium]
MALSIYRGTIIYTDTPDRFTVIKGGYVAVRDGIIEEVSEGKIPDKFRNVSVTDFGESLIIPAFSDLHIHLHSLPSAVSEWTACCLTG